MIKNANHKMKKIDDIKDIMEYEITSPGKKYIAFEALQKLEHYLLFLSYLDEEYVEKDEDIWITDIYQLTKEGKEKMPRIIL